LAACSIDQHRVCAPGSDKLRRYAAGTDPRDYDAATLVALIDGFRSVLQRHLANEVSMLLKLEKDYDSGALLKMWRVAEKAGTEFRRRSPTISLGFERLDVRRRHSRFSTCPLVLPYLVHYWFARKHTGAWRCPLDM
jgi:hypothetical protein